MMCSSINIKFAQKETIKWKFCKIWPFAECLDESEKYAILANDKIKAIRASVYNLNIDFLPLNILFYYIL